MEEIPLIDFSFAGLPAEITVPGADGLKLFFTRIGMFLVQAG